MESIRRCLHRWTWIALVAVLGVALAPTLSHAMAGDPASHPWTEVCSSTPQSPQPAGGEVADHGHADHCALCAQLGAAPPTSFAVAVPAPGAARIGPPEQAAPFARLAWRAAQPRGPPASA